MAVQRSLILIKPDGVERGLIGEIIARFENKGIRILALKILRFTDDRADLHYAEHLEKGFYPELKSFITSGPSVAMVLEGEETIALARKLMGATSFLNAEPGTIRGDYAFDATRNLVHGSDSPESAAREIPIFFSEDEILAG